MRLTVLLARLLLPLVLLACAAPHTPAGASAGLPSAGSPAAPPPAGIQDFQPLTIGDPPAEELEPFFPGSTHDAEVLVPDEVLGRPLGARMASHEEVLAIWHTWAEQSPRVTLEPYGLTHEGRQLVYAVVTSPANHERLEGIRSAIGRLADPRGLTPAEEDALIAETPAIAWLGYSIHGDETSGVDGGLALAHHLIASQDADVAHLLEQTVVVIDPCMNPDGRERYRSMMLQSAGAVPSLDTDSLSRGRWPWGRGNHYLFDMNRDWMAGIAPETRGRWSVLRRFPPQLFVDAHEMGALDTYLFYPQAPPHNPCLPQTLNHWQKVFADAQGAAFDRRGWSYYTREWADAWGPFYSDAWGSLNGAVGMLYEQARYGGQPLRRASGEVVTYREAAWHQAVASLASVTTLAEQREAVLRDYVAFKRANLDLEAPGRDRAFVLLPGRHPQRERWLVETLRAQGVELERLGEALTLREARSAMGERRDELELPAGTILIPPGQPQSALVRAFLSFDLRMDDEALLEEREELERDGSSGMYDLTSWCLAHALDLDAWWADAPAAGDGARVPLDRLQQTPTGVAAPADPDAPVYGWLVDGADDSAVAFAARALEAGLAVQLADEPFESAGRPFARGSLLVRRHENGPDVAEQVARAALEAGALAVPTGGARAPGEGPDLGGQHFTLLARPRVALLAGAPVSVSDFGHLWHLLDRELGVPVSLLEATSLSSYDLRRYNVLVLPSAGGSLRALVEPLREDLQAWVRSGGTLIAVGRSAGVVADADLGLSEVRRLREVLDERDAYHEAAVREWSARHVEVDPALVWGDEQPETGPEQVEGSDDRPHREEGDEAEREDRWRRRFMPRGATLAALVDDQAWITAGCGDALPVLCSGDQVLMAREPVRTAVRLAPAGHLRLAGLLWPEARERLAESAWLTVERQGQGQVILFAAQPAYRGFHKASGRLFANAVVLGPGAGASQPLGW